MFMKYSRPFVLALTLATMVTPVAFGKTKTDPKCKADCKSDYASKVKDCKTKKGKDRKDCMQDAKAAKTKCMAACKK